MIPFFRRIRKKMADDNRPFKYARYAIGEIILVVIGILIALQINNWNQLNKTKEKECFYLSAMLESIGETQKELKRVRDKSYLSAQACDTLFEILFNKHEIPFLTLDTIIQSSVDFTILTPDMGIVSEIMNSGKLEIISNEFIRKTLSASESRLSNINKYEVWATQIRYDYRSALLEYINRSNFIKEKSTIIEESRTEFFNDHLILDYVVSKGGANNFLHELYANELVLIDSLESVIIKELKNCKK